MLLLSLTVSGFPHDLGLDFAAQPDILASAVNRRQDKLRYLKDGKL